MRSYCVTAGWCGASILLCLPSALPRKEEQEEGGAVAEPAATRGAKPHPAVDATRGGIDDLEGREKIRGECRCSPRPGRTGKTDWWVGAPVVTCG